MTSCKTYHKYSDIPRGEWSELLQEDDMFLSEDFLKIIERSHQDEISPLYTVVKDENGVLGIMYSQVFDFKNSKLKNYIDTSKFNITAILKSQIGRLLGVKVSFLGNLFLSNELAFKFKGEVLTQSKFNSILKHIQESSGTKFLLIPESYDVFINKNSSKIKQINVEPDMHLKVSKDWNTFDDYLDCLRSKYKKRLRKIYVNSKGITKKEIDSSELKSKAIHLKELYGQVYEKSNFNSAKFNTDVFQGLTSLNKNIKIYGYYYNDELIGFSSVIKNNETLYAHFVGIDYEINHKYDLYGKMLFDHIKYAIDHKLQLIKFGRTACEFKSNFGAEPGLGRGYVYDKTGWYLQLLGPFLKLLKPKAWIQRKPFKLKEDR